MTETSPRHALPLLQAGQAQKEAYHNEALTLIDALVGLAAETYGANAPPVAPQPGQSWIVGGTPVGAWSGHPTTIALWTGGGWRFVDAPIGTPAWIKSEQMTRRRTASGWSDGRLDAALVAIGGVQVVGPRGPAIPAPTGGTTVDNEARSAISAVIVALKTHGLIDL